MQLTVVVYNSAVKKHHKLLCLTSLYVQCSGASTQAGEFYHCLASGTKGSK